VRGKGLHDITKFIEHWVEEQALHTGLLTVSFRTPRPHCSFRRTLISTCCVI
jgi:hypothetical protein